MKVGLKVIGDSKVQADFEESSIRTREEVRKATGSAGMLVLRITKQNKLTGQVLNVRTGRLRRSINMRMTVEDGKTTAVVGTNVEYAAIHEFGGKTIAHTIEAKRAKFLAWKGSDGKMIFRRKVNHPGSKFPERSFLRAALTDGRPQIKIMFEQAVQRGMP